MFGTQDVVGETMSIGGRSFMVVGVLEESGQQPSVLGGNEVVIPFTLAQRLYNVPASNPFTLQPRLPRKWSWRNM